MTREEIEKKAYEVYPEQKGYIPQDPYPPMEIDINAHKREGYIKGLTEQPDCPKIKGWVARDKDGTLLFGGKHPDRIRSSGTWMGFGQCMKIDRELYPDLCWEDDPIEVELQIRPL